MKQPEYIDHQGVIKSIDPHFISVEILSKSACSSCHAKGACSLGDVKVKVVEVENVYGADFQNGEIVNVRMRRTLGYKALWISYLIPLIILVVLLVSLSSVNVPEPVTGISVIGALALYYVGVWIFRDKLRKEFVFTVEKL
ncbi:MAG: SoxR reducing system RseC family protein [Bacteroidales bacterium]|jgi:sigma-E factor negative regulatory protein RseC|nr:SoxR reducing system RseC family protein [Bacteroidales bacterium]MDD3300675.1 SoxR reducing system RseC family protein [Bacteroidales bacterium]MDD3843849.1 SoxR reducing system RseC family protein [Bacteroidales bacterium]MDD4618028.1 SoxR reducing system RseC family protein [Bacteroidales bacterium]